jgi:hypothetical protein
VRLRRGVKTFQENELVRGRVVGGALAIAGCRGRVSRIKSESGAGGCDL